jgi:glycosyltransferase involved in cell wall biosynthesis
LKEGYIELKILLISYYPLPYPGGIWTFASLLKKGLERLGHTVDILSHNPDATKFRIINRQPELTISQLSPFINEKITETIPSLYSNEWIYQVELFRYSLELSALYYGIQQYDIIHALDVTAARAISRIKPKHIPLITSALGNLSKDIFYFLKSIYRHKTDQQLLESFEYQYYRTIEHEGYHSSDLIHSPSNWMHSNIMNNFSIPSDKLFTFSYGMDVEEFLKPSDVDFVNSSPKDKKIILFVGRLVYLKGIHHIIDALAMLKGDRNDWECWIIGEGDLKHELQEQCQTLGLTNEVKFLGVSDNVSHFLRQADIFVHPSLYDTQPYSIMEAQISGVPVIVSDAGGLPEMVEIGKSGLITEVGNIQELCEQIKYLLANDAIRKQLASDTKGWAQAHWSIDKMVNNFLAMYKHVKR